MGDNPAENPIENVLGLLPRFSCEAGGVHILSASWSFLAEMVATAPSTHPLSSFPNNLVDPLGVSVFSVCGGCIDEYDASVSLQM